MIGRSAGRILSSSFGLLAGLFALFSVFAGTANAQAQDCSDFATQEEAQQFYNDHRDDDADDPDPFQLDTDGDGQACEGLPTAQGATQASPTPTASPGSNQLPQNGAETGVIALSGLSLLEAGYGLTLASKRLGIRRRSIPLYLMRRMINAAERGGDRIEVADDVYLVHASALERRPDLEQDDEPAFDDEPRFAAPALEDDDTDHDLRFDDEFIEIELESDEVTDDEPAFDDEPETAAPAPAPSGPSVYAALARPGVIPPRQR